MGALFPQKSNLYTDGLGDGADHNLERAYEIPEQLQSNDPDEREAGDESLSDEAKDQKSDDDKRRARQAKKKDDDTDQ